MNLKKYTMAKLITTVASVATLLAGWGIIDQTASAATAPSSTAAVSQPATTTVTNTASTTSQSQASAKVTTRTRAS